MLRIEESFYVRVTTDDMNPRIHLTEYRCAECGKWVQEEDAVWIENKAYHVECAPEQADAEPVAQREADRYYAALDKARAVLNQPC